MTSSMAAEKASWTGALSPMEVEDTESTMIVVIIIGVVLALICLPCVIYIPYTVLWKPASAGSPSPAALEDGNSRQQSQPDVAQPRLQAQAAGRPPVSRPPAAQLHRPTEEPHRSAAMPGSGGAAGMASTHSLAGAVMSQESLPPTAKSMPQTADSHFGVPLCESLVVPRDVECALVIPVSAAGPPSKGQICSFNVTDPKGEPIVGFSIVAPQGEAPGGRAVPRIVMSSIAGGAMLASCSAQPDSMGGPFFLCRPAGEFFAILERDAPASDAHRFVLAEANGKRHLFEVPQAKGRLGISDERGSLRAEVAPWTSPGTGEQSLLVRIGPSGDVGAFLCGLICSLQILQIDYPFDPNELVRRISSPTFTQFDPC